MRDLSRDVMAILSASIGVLLGLFALACLLHQPDAAHPWVVAPFMLVTSIVLTCVIPKRIYRPTNLHPKVASKLHHP